MARQDHKSPRGEQKETPGKKSQKGNGPTLRKVSSTNVTKQNQEWNPQGKGKPGKPPKNTQKGLKK